MVTDLLPFSKAALEVQAKSSQAGTLLSWNSLDIFLMENVTSLFFADYLFLPLLNLSDRQKHFAIIIYVLSIFLQFCLF